MGHEFNGNWYPWGIVNNNSNPALYVAAYRRVHDLVVAAGATNVQWSWSFNNGAPLVTRPAFPPGVLQVELSSTFGAGSAWPSFFFDFVKPTLPALGS